MMNLRKLSSEKAYRHEIYICFWLAIHMENFEFSTYLANLNEANDLRKDCTRLVSRSIKDKYVSEKVIKKVLKRHDSYVMDEV